MLPAIDREVDKRLVETVRIVAGSGPIDPAALARQIETLERNRDTGDIGLLLLDTQGRRVAGRLSPARRLPRVSQISTAATGSRG